MSAVKCYLAVEGLGVVVPARTVGRVVRECPADLICRRLPEGADPEAFVAEVRAHAARLEAGESYHFADGKGVMDALEEFAARDGLAFDPAVDTNVHYDQCSRVRKVFVSLSEFERFADLDDVTGFHEGREVPADVAQKFGEWAWKSFGAAPKRGMFVYQQFRLELPLDESDESPSD